MFPAAWHCVLNAASPRVVLLKYILMYCTVAGASLVGGPFDQPASPFDQTFAMIWPPTTGTFFVIVCSTNAMSAVRGQN